MSGAPVKKLPTSPRISSPSVPVSDRGSEKVNVGFSDFGAGSSNQLRDPRLRRSAGMLPGLVSGYLARVSDPKRVFVFLDVLQEGPQVRGIVWTKLWLRDDRRSLSLVLVGDTVKHSRNDDFHFICSPVKFFNRESKERDTESPLPFLSAFRLNRSAIGSAFRNAQKNL